MSLNQWGAVNQWQAASNPTVINAALASTSTTGLSATVLFPVNVNASIATTTSSALSATVTINGQRLTVNASLSSTTTAALTASVTITPAPSEPIIINAALGSTYSTGYRASVTIGTVTIRIYSGTHYEIPNY